MISTLELKQELKQHYGTTQWYKHPLTTKMTYTDGVQAFAALAGAYWLLDIIATEIAPLQATEDFLSIELLVDNDKAKLFADDGNQAILFSKTISFTDCPKGEWKFFLTGGVLMLPSEY